MNDNVRTRRNWIVGALVFGGLAVATLWFLHDQSATPAASIASSDIAALTERLAALERRNSELMARMVNRQDQATIGRQANAARSLMREQSKEQQRRMLEDPAYAEQEQRKRLAGLEQAFKSEPVSIQWASKASVQVEDALASAAKNSGAPRLQGQVDCRSTQCRIQINVSENDYDALITYLSIGMGDLLPKARIVSIRRSDGTQDVSIFASDDKGAPRPGGG